MSAQSQTMVLSGMLSKLSTLVFCFLAATKPSDAGCLHRGKTFKAGENVNLLGECMIAVCQKDGHWSQVTPICGCLGRLPYKWSFVPEDLSKPYPECCDHFAPPLNIVPDLLDKLQDSGFLEILYDNDVKVDQGNELTPSQVKNPPRVNFNASPESWYLLRMTDADSPNSREQKSRGFHHWLVGNIPGNNVAGGEVIYDYIGAGPAQERGLHRYVFLLYKQPRKLTFDEARSSNTSIDHRFKMTVRQFSEKYGLGDPQAVDVFQAQYDDYVHLFYTNNWETCIDYQCAQCL